MGCSVRELLKRFDSSELTEWQAYEEIQPFGIERQEVMLGLILAYIQTAWGGEQVSPLDVIPDWGGLRKREAESDG